MKLGMISLGCAKNLVDSELFLGLCTKYNIEITNDITEADIITINTCGFIDKAKEESLDTIMEIVKIKEGIEQEFAKKITKAIKDSKLKVQSSIQGQELRVSGKSRDDLQQTIQLIKDLNLDLPLQYINFRD